MVFSLQILCMRTVIYTKRALDEPYLLENIASSIAELYLQPVFQCDLCRSTVTWSSLYTCTLCQKRLCEDCSLMGFIQSESALMGRCCASVCYLCDTVFIKSDDLKCKSFHDVD